MNLAVQCAQPVCLDAALNSGHASGTRGRKSTSASTAAAASSSSTRRSSTTASWRLAAPHAHPAHPLTLAAQSHRALLAECSLLLGMHPDQVRPRAVALPRRAAPHRDTTRPQATEPIVDAALALGRPFAVVRSRLPLKAL